jgi:hypothetical protein
MKKPNKNKTPFFIFIQLRSTQKDIHVFFFTFGTEMVLSNIYCPHGPQ